MNFEVSTNEHGQLVASRLVRPNDSKYLYVPDATSSELIPSVTRHLEHSAIAEAVQNAEKLSGNLRRNHAATVFLRSRTNAYHRIIEKNLGPENERHAIKRLLHDLESFADMVSREWGSVNACDSFLDKVQRIENTLDLSINEASQGVNLLSDSDAVREALPDSDVDKKLPAALVL